MITCENCTNKCCNWINFPCPTRELQVYYRTRGFIVKHGLAWHKLPCPRFKDGKCEIHENKPEICKRFPMGSATCEVLKTLTV